MKMKWIENKQTKNTEFGNELKKKNKIATEKKKKNQSMWSSLRKTEEKQKNRKTVVQSN